MSDSIKKISENGKIALNCVNVSVAVLTVSGITYVATNKEKVKTVAHTIAVISIVSAVISSFALLHFESPSNKQK